MQESKVVIPLKKALGWGASTPLILTLILTQLTPSFLLLVVKYFSIFITICILFNIIVIFFIILSIKTIIFHEKYRAKILEIGLITLIAGNIFFADTFIKKLNEDKNNEILKYKDSIIKENKQKISSLESKIEFYIKQSDNYSGSNIESFQKTLANLDFLTAELMLTGNSNPLLVQQSLNNRLTNGSGKIGIEFVAENINQPNHQEFLNLIFSRENMDPYFAFSDGDIKRSAMWYALHYGNLPMVRALISAGAFSHPYQTLLGRFDDDLEHYNEIRYPIVSLRRKGFASTEDGREIIRLLHKNGLFFQDSNDAGLNDEETVSEIKSLNVSSQPTIKNICSLNTASPCDKIDNINKKYCDIMNKIPRNFAVQFQINGEYKFRDYSGNFYLDRLINFSPEGFLMMGHWKGDSYHHMINVSPDGTSFFIYNAALMKNGVWRDTGFGLQQVSDDKYWESYRNSFVYGSYGRKFYPVSNCS